MCPKTAVSLRFQVLLSGSVCKEPPLQAGFGCWVPMGSMASKPQTAAAAVGLSCAALGGGECQWKAANPMLLADNTVKNVV